MIKTGSKEKSSKNVSTFCRKIGCKNYNHSGFKMRQTKSTAEKWIEWLKIGGVDMDLPENRDRKNLRLCFRHFKRENLVVTNGVTKQARLVPTNYAVPFYYYGDKKDIEDKKFHRELSQRYNKTRQEIEEDLSVDEKETLLMKEVKKLAKKAKKKEQDEHDRKEQEKNLAENKQERKRRQKLNEKNYLNSLKPQDALSFDSLVITASTIHKDIRAAQKLVVFDTVSHDPGLKDNSSSEACKVMFEIREAILRHDWDLALKLLPMLSLMRYGQHFIWQCYLQIFCHHPNTTPELLHELLQVCLQNNSINCEDFKEIFCLRSELPMNEEERKTLFRMNSTTYKKSSVIHKMQQDASPNAEDEI